MTDKYEAIRKALAAGPTPGPWYVDTEENEGEYGDGGPDSRSGFQSFALFNEAGSTICDTLNSDAAEVEEDYSEEGGSAWDAVGKRNMEFIAACDPATIASLLADADRARELEADARRLDWLESHGGMIGIDHTAYGEYRYYAGTPWFKSIRETIDRAQGEQK